jgi:hypothetical protein
MGPPVSDRSWARCRTVTRTLALQIGGKNSIVSKPQQQGGHGPKRRRRRRRVGRRRNDDDDDDDDDSRGLYRPIFVA